MKHFWKFTVPTHLIGISSAVYAVMTEAWWFFGAAFVIWALLSIGVEVGIHRLFSHKAFKTKRWIEALLAYLGTIAGQGSVMFWVAVHKGYHHPYSDTEKDPHSPVHGFYQSYVGWLIDDTQYKISYRSTVELMRDKMQVFLHKNYYSVIVATIIALVLIHPLLAAAYFLASTVAIQQNFIVNVTCHLKSLGYRNFDTKDSSRNVGWLSILSWGLSLHNNHHHDPGSYTLALKPGELDISSWVIKLISSERREPRAC